MKCSWGSSWSSGLRASSSSSTSPKSEAVMCLMGDATTNIGAFHESLNLAGVRNLPIVVRDAARAALTTAREGRRPVLLELMRYRLKGHSVVDRRATVRKKTRMPLMTGQTQS
ncbi:thiamine pyrophosphate-dependent enzyme [Rhodoglobus vestalii]|uniref:thiamine pyrophosphate-dependent enzyme n=1 Tax=Rhodoglobus vestalii TaxID=193384 RepID=UPI003CCC4A43